MSELKKTPLNQLHHQLSAKMVPFAGYSMPLNYAMGIIQEHHHCREQAGFFDISHMGQFYIKGSEIAKQLEKVSPGNFVGLNIGQQRYAVLTNEHGGIVDDVIITRTDTGFMMVVNAACQEKDFAHLSLHLSEQCHLEHLQDHALFALQGPGAVGVMEQLSTKAANLLFMHACATQIADMDCLVSRSGYTGEDGFEISIAKQYAETLAHHLLAFDQVAPIGLGARDTLRLEAGLSLYGYELDETISPVAAGLKWTFRKQATDFLGADIILSQLTVGSQQIRVGLTIDGKIPVREQSVLFDDQNSRVGIVTSGGYSPCLDRPIALALIDRDYNGRILYARVRNRMIATHITPLPFVPHRFFRR